MIRHVILGKNRFSRALGYTKRAVNARVRIDDQKVRAVVKAIDRADVDTVRLFAFDAVLCDDVGHFLLQVMFKQKL